ncbi:Thyroid hormone receptor-associated protein 3 [Heterocephalus glaber]|uniref:Thyroid hormone receptor-associated protein 3 n=1 Tax=Heterocephalus glaber TaxID=10181 RepID=G5C6F8_HETGA|nr:Thyroid hormone receptor-associated protein 3 [Heterocephalus glaber]
MSKTNKSKSGSRSSRSRSASRSRSRSFSKSRSRSRSISRSRKRRLSSRSRSRSYSPAHNRERNHPRVYQNRDFRGHNRGYRRPYYFRGRNRGFYPWGQYNRGGYGNYRSNWQNYRQAYSPRRGRSRSRSPKRRSPSPRSRSHSRNSDKSSSDRSRRSSSSRSSSNHSRVESSKRKSAKEKKSSSKDSRPSQAAGDNQGDEAKEQTFSGGTSQDTKASESSKPWPDATYSTGSTSRASAVSDLSPRERSPALKSPLQSVVVRRRSPRPSPVPKPSPPLSNTSQIGSSGPSGGGYQSGTHQSQFDHGSGSLSPSKKSPVGKSPPTGSAYGSSQKEESAGSGGTAYTKRQVFNFLYLEEQKTENGKDKEQKQTNSDKEKVKEKGSFSDADAKLKSDSFASKTDTEKSFRGSQSPKRYKLRDDFEKKMADFHKEEMDDQDKDKTKGRKESEFDDEPKFMSKVIAGTSKNQEEEKSGKWEGLVYSGKEKQRKAEELEEEPFTERSKKEERGGAKRSESGHRGFVPEKNFRVTAYKAVQEKSSSPPPRKTSESREKLGAKGDFSSGKSSFSITREAQVNVRMDSFDEDLARPSGLLAQERKLCRDLVHSNKKEQEFRSIFQHIQSAQSQRSPSELFAQHIVTIVHHVKEHHFGSSGLTLHERFTKYLKRGAEQEAAKNKKSPEIHRRIDISPSTFRKHGLTHDEMKSPREPGYKAEGKYKDDPVDLRLDIERRKKHKERDLKRGKSRESVDSRDSSHSRERSTEKTEKTHKGSKKKKHRRARDRSRSSSSSSQSSHSYKVEEYPEETEEREESTTGFDKSRLGTKDFVGPSERGGRARGTFQFRARGRGWGRGNYSGNNNNSSNDFQKRSREEEWDPEYTPKSKKYYLHDDREGEGSDKWVSRGRGRGAFPRGRGRFMFRKSSTSPKWAHDKFSGEEGEIEDDESGTENREEKDNLQPTTE